MLAVRLTATAPGALTRTFAVETEQRRATITAVGDTITLTGQPADQLEGGLRFAQEVKVMATGGTVTAADGAITVTGADEILVLLSAGTNYRLCMDESYNYFTDADPLEGAKARVAAAAAAGYEALLAAHIADYDSRRG